MPTTSPKVELSGVTFYWSNGKGINDEDDEDDYGESGADEKGTMQDAQTPEPLKVLIVSRDAQTPRMLEEILSREGMLVDVPKDLEDAWNQVKTGEVGLIIHDLISPRLDDLVFFRTVRSSIKTIDVPFLFLLKSNYKLPKMTPEGGESVRDGWLTLPCPSQQFALLVQRMLQQMIRRWERGSKAQIASKTSMLRRKQMAADQQTTLKEDKKVAGPATKPAAGAFDKASPGAVTESEMEAPAVGTTAPQAELSGSLDVIDLPQVLSMIEPMRLTGTLAVKDDRRAGTIYFVEGSVCHARMMDIEGPDALFLLFHMKKGTFRFDRGEPVTIRTIQGNVTALLLEGMRQMDMAKEAIKQYQAKRGTAPVKKKQ